MADLRTDPVTLAQLLRSDQIYWAPLFQREFVWQQSKIQMLFEDALTVDEGQSESRFLGAVVFEAEEARIGHPTRYWVIDGQQRLTTLFLFLAAIVADLKRRGAEEKAASIAENYLFISAAGEMKNEPKYRPTVLDTAQFNVVLRSMRIPEIGLVQNAQGPESGKMTSGYKLAQRLLRKRVEALGPEEAVEWLWGFASCLLQGVRFVTITLGDDHDPTEVFDRLNARGEPLKVIDLVRNEVLKVVAKDLNQAIPLRDQYWLPFHAAFQGDDSVEQRYFFPVGLTRDSTIKKSKVFELFSKRWTKMRLESPDQSPRALVRIAIDDLREFQDSYCAFMLTGALGTIRSDLAPGDRTDVNVRVSRLHRLKASVVTMPYLVQLLNAIVDQSVAVKDGLACLDVVEAFLVRRAIMGIEPTGLHAVFKGLWDPDDLDPESLERRLTTATVVFPNDEEFSLYIRTGHLYGRNVCHFVLWERELGYEEGDKHPGLIPFHACHLIPRQLTDGELASWGGDWSKTEWNSLKNTWANLFPLTPEGNWSMARMGWDAARDLLAGNMVLKTPQQVMLRYQTWTPDDLRDRGEELAEWAVSRWPKLT